MRKTILIVDDEADIRNLVKEILEDEGYATLTAANSKQTYEILEQQKPDMAILDIWLQDSRHDGLGILETIKAGEHKDIPVIMISGHGTIETAVNAIKKGAYDFIEKPFKSDRLILMVRRALEAASLQKENAVLKEQTKSSGGKVDIIGTSSHAKTLRERVKALSASNSRLLIEGPLGAGKTTISRLIHNASARGADSFYIYVCNADETVRGTIEEAIDKAEAGTIVFQDIDALPEADQNILLKVLQNNDLKPRIISTSRNVDSLNKNLYQRLCVEKLVVPSLAERKQDIKDILDVYVTQVALELGIAVPQVSSDVVKLCEKYTWTGNLYELQAVIMCALIHNDGAGKISADALPARISGRGVDAANVEVLNMPEQHLDDAFLDLPLRDARDVFEREYLTSQVERFEGNISKTAQFIGMERSALHRKIKSLQDKSAHDDLPEPKAVSAKTQ